MTVAQTREEKQTVAGTRWYIVHAYTNFERKVADSIRERRDPAASGLDGLKAVEVTVAAYKSAKSKQRVAV